MSSPSDRYPPPIYPTPPPPRQHIRKSARNATAQDRRQDGAEAAVVLAIWLGTVIAAGWLVNTYGSRFVPVGDDIHATIPTVVPNFPDAVRASWDQHNEHRVPISRLVLWGILNATDFNLKAVMYVNVAMYGLFALVMIFAARALRGRIRYMDAFFPLIALCWSQATNFLFAWQLQLAISLLVVGILLAVAAANVQTVSPFGTIVAGMCVILLPLTGANGVVMVPASAAWLGFHGVMSLRRQKGRARWRAIILIGSAVASLAIVGVYLVGLQRAEDVFRGRVVENPGVRDYFTTGLELLGSALGPPLYESLDEGHTYYAGAIVLVVFALGPAGLIYVARKRPTERIRMIGLGLFMVSQWCLIGAMTWGRAPFGPGAAAADRYYTFLVPLYCCIYLVWVAGRSPVARVVQVALLLFAAGVYGGNIKRLDWVKYFREVNSGAIEKYFSTRRTAAEVAQHWVSTVNVVDPEYFETFIGPRFQMLKDARLGPYRLLADVPPLRTVLYPLDRKPYARHHAEWDSGVCEVRGEDAWVVLSLTEPRFVYAVRLTYRYEPPTFHDRFEMSWRLGDHEPFRDDRKAVYDLLAGAENRTVTVIVNEKVDQFQLRPANQPCRFLVSQIELLVPAATAN
jgi:hypothetical protein